MPKKTVSYILALSFLFCSACTKSSSDDENTDDTTNNNATRLFTSLCGTVFGGELVNPIPEKDAIPVTVTQIGSQNLIIVSRTQGNQLVKLQGISDSISNYQLVQAFPLLESMKGEALLYPANDECYMTTGDGAEALVGSLFIKSNGTSFSEALLKNGLAEAVRADYCQGSLIGSCYDAIADENRQEISDTVTNFLWKPVSERDGNLVVLLSPAGATVVVNGTILLDYGPSNGRGTTARANQSGCSFGSNIKVEAFDSEGRPLAFPGMQTSYTIANGCDRVEF